MKKLLSATLLSIFLLTFSFTAVFAQVGGPKEGCRIPAGREAGRWETFLAASTDPSAGEPVSPLFVALKKSGQQVNWDVLNANIEEGYNGDKTYKLHKASAGSLEEDIDSGNVVAGPDWIIIPQIADADQAGGINIDEGDTLPSNWSVFCFLDTIDTVVDWIFTILIVAAVGFIVVAGFMWIVGGAAPEQKDKAKTMIFAAVVGIVIAILAKLIPALITGILT